MTRDLEWLEQPMRPEPIAHKVDEEVRAPLDAYDEKVRALFEQHCREVIEDASKSLDEYRRSLAKSLASPARIWNFRAWMERRFEDDLDRWEISYQEARIRKAMLALSEKELSKT
jgi:hypothetical protein